MFHKGNSIVEVAAFLHMNGSNLVFPDICYVRGAELHCIICPGGKIIAGDPIRRGYGSVVDFIAPSIPQQLAANGFGGAVGFVAVGDFFVKIIPTAPKLLNQLVTVSIDASMELLIAKILPDFYIIVGGIDEL